MFFHSYLTKGLSPLLIFLSIMMFLIFLLYPLYLAFALFFFIFTIACTLNGTLLRFCLWNLGFLLWWYSPVASILFLCLLAYFGFSVNFNNEGVDETADTQACLFNETMLKSRQNQDFWTRSRSSYDQADATLDNNSLSSPFLLKRNAYRLFSMGERPYRIVEMEYKGPFKFCFDRLQVFQMKTKSTCSTCTESSVCSTISDYSTSTFGSLSFLPSFPLLVPTATPSSVSVMDNLCKQLVDLTISSKRDDSKTCVSLFGIVLDQVIDRLSQLHLKPNWYRTSRVRSSTDQTTDFNRHFISISNDMTDLTEPNNDIAKDYSQAIRQETKDAGVKELTTDELGEVLSSMMNTNMTLNDRYDSIDNRDTYNNQLDMDGSYNNIPQVSLDDIAQLQSQHTRAYSYHSNSANSDVTSGGDGNYGSLCSQSNASVATTVLYVDDQVSL